MVVRKYLQVVQLVMKVMQNIKGELTITTKKHRYVMPTLEKI